MGKIKPINAHEVMARRDRFYVYALYDEADNIFYVGKGIGRRITSHAREASDGCPCPKCVHIRGIWERGGEVYGRIFYTTHIERKAYAYEAEMIAAVGLDNLVNIHPGQPDAGYAFSPDVPMVGPVVLKGRRPNPLRKAQQRSRLERR